MCSGRTGVLLDEEPTTESEVYSVIYEEGLWRLSYWERGRKSAIKSFPTEHDSCVFLAERYLIPSYVDRKWFDQKINE